MTLKQLVGLGKRLGLSTILFLSLPATIVKAQVVPDRSLPTIVEQLREIMKINGGQREGNNLFHSFEEFSIPEGKEAVFENASDIENIFTRVTGESISNINCFIRTQGGANLFLVNPNGIVFGENAQLDIGGSFIATTGQNIQFEDGTEFSADTKEQPILTVSVPIGVQFEGDSGAIEVNGNGSQIINDSSFAPVEFGRVPAGISVSDNKTLALIGNGLNFDSGVVTTKGGRVYLSSVESGSVAVSQTENSLTLSNDNVTEHRDINLNRQSLIDASLSGGTIFLTGKNISFQNASFLLAQNQGNLLGGSVNIKASESITLSGKSPDGEIASTIRAESLSTGKGGNIDISATQLQLNNSARIQTATFGESTSGNINIRASDAIELNSGIISSITLGEANAANIELLSSKLNITDKGVLTAATLGTGNGGEIIISADSIDVVEDPENKNQTDRTNISASSFNAGNAGNITIDTQRLQIVDGASLSSSSFNTGNAGNVTVDASESIEVSGKNANFQSSSNPESTIRTAVQLPRSRRRENSQSSIVQTGSSGNLILNTPSLSVSEQATVTVENEGLGNAGTLLVNADKVDLDTFGSITATSASGQKGNINLQIDQLQLDENSSITATAENDGNGGNINITTRSLIAKKTLK